MTWIAFVPYCLLYNVDDVLVGWVAMESSFMSEEEGLMFLLL